MKLPYRADDPDFLLRRALQANLIFSAVFGVGFVVGDEALAGWFGRAGSMAPDGVGLLVFAVALALLATRPSIPLRPALAVVVLDLLWVIGAFAEVARGGLSSAGAVTMAVLALAVLDFALFQGLGLRQSRRLRLEGEAEPR